MGYFCRGGQKAPGGQHPKASILKGGRVVFNIKANDYRLIALIHYRRVTPLKFYSRAVRNVRQKRTFMHPAPVTLTRLPRPRHARTLTFSSYEGISILFGGKPDW